MWELKDGDVVRGPFTDEQVVAAIGEGLPATIQVRPMGSPQWMLLGAHAPFAEAMAKTQRPATPSPQAAPAPMTAHIVSGQAGFVGKGCAVQALGLRFAGGGTRTFGPQQGGGDVDTLDAAILDTITRGHRLLGSVLAHQVVLLLITRAHDLARSLPTNGTAAPRVELPGGWADLAKALDITHKGAPDQIRSIVLTLAHCRFQLPGGSYGNLLVYQENARLVERRGPGRPPRGVVLTLGDPLCPGYAKAMKRDGGSTRLECEARKLVAIPRTLPPFVGREQDHGAQASFWWQLLCALRLRARDIATHKGALLDVSALSEMAESVGMPRTMTIAGRTVPGFLAPLQRWTSTASADGPAFLELVDGAADGLAPMRLHLAPALPAEREWLRAQGEEENAASERAQLASTKKPLRAARKRRSPP